MSRERFKPFAAVYAVLRRGDEVLLLRRQGSKFYDGWYSLPAGHIDGAETLSQAAIREAREEIGVEIAPADLQFAHLSHRASNPAEEQGEAREYIDTYFVATKWQGEPRICEPEKCDEVRWASISDLPKNIIPYVRQVLELIAKHDPYSELGW